MQLFYYDDDERPFMPWKNIYLHIHAAFKSIFPLKVFYKYLYLVSGVKDILTKGMVFA